MDDPARRAGGDQHIPRPEVWTQHEDPPWPNGSSWKLEEIADSVRSSPAPLVPAFPEARVSSVLVALFDGDRGVEVLLTRRSMELSSHRGEISFPGGRLDPGETPIETALREASEEVGLDPSAPKVVGELGHLSTIVSQSCIVPIVAVLDERPGLSAQTMEVDRVMWTPLSEFSMPGTYRFERWGVGPTEPALHFFELDDETVWGATAYMLVELLTYSNHR